MNLVGGSDPRGLFSKSTAVMSHWCVSYLYRVAALKGKTDGAGSSSRFVCLSPFRQ
jgi:hypothetical protein